MSVRAGMFAKFSLTFLPYLGSRVVQSISKILNRVQKNVVNMIGT